MTLIITANTKVLTSWKPYGSSEIYTFKLLFLSQIKNCIKKKKQNI